MYITYIVAMGLVLEICMYYLVSCILHDVPCTLYLSISLCTHRDKAIIKSISDDHKEIYGLFSII